MKCFNLKNSETPPSPPPIVMSELLENFQNDREFVMSLLEVCVETFPEYLETLKNSKECSEIKDAAHALKGSAANLQSMPLLQDSTTLEHQASQTSVTYEEIKPLIEVVIARVDALVSFIEKEMARETTSFP